MPRGMTLALGVAALVIAAWFALGVRQAIDTDRASVIVGRGGVSVADAAHADALLRSAGWLNPDRTVDVLRGRLLLDEGRAGAARAALLKVALAEPRNAAAWVAFGSAAAGDRQAFLLALAHVHELVPPVPAPR